MTTQQNAPSMQPAPATEQARFEAYYRLGEKAKQRDPDPEFAHRYYDEIVQAKWEGWQDRATQAERVQSSESIDGPLFQDILSAYGDAYYALLEGGDGAEGNLMEADKQLVGFINAWGGQQSKAGRAYQKKVDDKIDARCATASKAETAVACNAALRAAPAMPVDADSTTQPAWEPVTRAGQVKVGDKLRFKIGDGEYRECVKLILNAGTDKEEVIYNKRENFYFITSMVLNGRSNHKGVEVLAANTKEGTL